MDTLAGGLPYMVMELLRGNDLRRVIKKQGPQPVELAVAYVLQAADAIEEAHALGVIHRDLKPSNLFLTQRRDGKPLVKVLDFGISKSLADFGDVDLTTSRAMIGSPRYMSPEQVRDAKNVDERADIWSLGAILYELLMGHGAFRADSLPAICAAIVSDQPPPILPNRPDVLPELERAIFRCLEKDPRARYGSVAELKAALAVFVPSQVVPSVPPPPADLPAISVRDSFLATGELAPSFAVSNAPALSPTRPSPGDEDLNRNEETAAFRTPSTIRRQPKRSRRRLLVFVAGGLFVALAIAMLLLAPWRSSPAEAPGTMQAETSFLLRIESVPSGADVLEGERVLGKTPLEVRVESKSVDSAPRIFTLEQSGYRPYTLEQGMAGEDVRVRAELVKKPEPTPSSPPSSEPAPTPRRTWTKPSTHDKPAGKGPKPGTDIRLER